MSPCDSKTIWWDDGLWMIDQTKLPLELKPIKIETMPALIEAIRSLRVRGAPALKLAVPAARTLSLPALNRATSTSWLRSQISVME